MDCILGRLVLVGQIFISLVSCVTTKASAPKATVGANQGLLFFDSADSMRFVWPVRGVVSSTYGERNKRMHFGLDIKAPPGSPIVAVSNGRVLRSGWQTGYGNTLIIGHGSLLGLYAHCSKLIAKRGNLVNKGETVALVGRTGDATGNHLHFEVRSRLWTALNPLDYLPLNWL